MYRLIFKNIKSIIPKVSETEMVALRSGTTSIDRNFFMGKVDISNFPTYNKSSSKLSELTPQLNELLKKYQSTQIYPNQEIDKILKDISATKLFGLIIDSKYGGHRLSTVELSRLLVLITSANPSLGVTVMVPNSLGPAELLDHYGTTDQKEKYLPKLAKGECIPCFGLTGPNNGSDATSQIDRGIVKKINGEIKIEINLNKRYITLAPVANLIGVAFNLEDPNKLLQSGLEGITVALIPNTQEGLIKDTYHNPLNVGFPNGTLKGTIHISPTQIIGGEKNAGQGWKMLMECLASGRAVSLPATALAASKVATYGVYNYSLYREQFKIPLIKMEAIQNKISDMLFHTWLIECSTSLINNLLDSGDRPAVLSALMKQQTTDRAREVLNHGMDIQGGGAICLGYTNFLEKFYRSAPISITVEGSNTLTKNLIIFGQGLNKSHPYIFPILENILDDDFNGFKKNIKSQLQYAFKLYFKTFSFFNTALEKQVISFAILSNFIALQGGKIKSNQSLSGDMADIFSNLYLAYSVKWYHKHNNISDTLTNYCVDRLLDENTTIINRVISNNNFYLLWHLRKKIGDIKYSRKKDLIIELGKNEKIMNVLKTDLYTSDNILGDFELLENLNSDNDHYHKLVDKIIQVDEFNIIKG